MIAHTTFGSLSFQSWPDGASQVIAIEEFYKVPHMPIDAYHYGQSALAMPIVVWMRSTSPFNIDALVMTIVGCAYQWVGLAAQEA
jgi:hypothetical protein